MTVVMKPAATVRGRALDPSGQPIAGLEIETNYFDEYASELLRFHEQTIGKTTTDAEGRFEMKHMLPGQRFNLDAKPYGDYIRAQAKPELIRRLGLDVEKSVRRLAAPHGGDHDFGDLLFGPPRGPTLPWPDAN